ncbi:hypothetical protein MTR67_039075 [Solanum verrucosum]|uniref:Uncharacterized protein n=1 Tax=Solanum verrucosum TaxID=315347 RepID=A0AAF0UH72_SOLVR|nr:hypothetical protein MTR67_039075 [Solanum verrucosum]
MVSSHLVALMGYLMWVVV